MRYHKCTPILHTFSLTHVYTIRYSCLKMVLPTLSTKSMPTFQTKRLPQTLITNQTRIFSVLFQTNGKFRIFKLLRFRLKSNLKLKWVLLVKPNIHSVFFEFEVASYYNHFVHCEVVGVVPLVQSFFEFRFHFFWVDYLHRDCLVGWEGYCFFLFFFWGHFPILIFLVVHFFTSFY